MSAIGRRRRFERVAARRGRAPRPRILGIIAAILVMLAGMFLWLRDSPLVAVEKVTVTGQNGPDGGQIGSALVAAARTMTTLDVDLARLRRAVAGFRDVKAIQVSTQFPHGMRIHVLQQVPVAVVKVQGRPVEVASDGTLLAGVPVSSWLPQLSIDVPLGSTRLMEGFPADAVAILASAPRQFLSRIGVVTQSSTRGVAIAISGGPSIYFGDGSQPGRKWAAALAVLADARSPGAVYIDVSDPARPVAGATSATTSSAGTAATQSGTAANQSASAGAQSASATTGSSATVQTTTSGG